MFQGMVEIFRGESAAGTELLRVLGRPARPTRGDRATAAWRRHLRDGLRRRALLTRPDAIKLALGEAERAVRPRASAAQSILTRREEQIAGLIAEGQSNREIAEAPVISVRTVDTNVDTSGASSA